MYDDIGETPNTPLMEEGPTAVCEFVGPYMTPMSHSILSPLYYWLFYPNVEFG